MKGFILPGIILLLQFKTFPVNAIFMQSNFHCIKKPPTFTVYLNNIFSFR